jgi:hypothetical protein
LILNDNPTNYGTVIGNQCCGSGAFLTPGSETGKKSRSGSGMNIPDLKAEKQFFWFKILKFFDADPDRGSRTFLTLDPGSGMEKIWIRDGKKFGSEHPGSATLFAM